MSSGGGFRGAALPMFALVSRKPAIHPEGKKYPGNSARIKTPE